MNTYKVSVEYRLPTTNDRNDGFGDFPKYEWRDYDIQAETPRKAVNTLQKFLDKKLFMSGTGVNTIVSLHG